MKLPKLVRPILSSALLLWIPLTATSQEAESDAKATPAPQLVRQEESEFDKLYTVEGLSLKSYKNIVPASGGIEYKNVRRGSYAGQTEFALHPKEKEQLDRVFGGLFVKELMNWDRFPLVEAPEPDSIYLKVKLTNVVSYVPPPRIRMENRITEIISGSLLVELYELRNGHMIMKVEDTVLIKDIDGMRREEFIWTLESVQKQFSDWGASLKTELQRFDK